MALEVAPLHAAIVRCNCSRSRESPASAGSGESISRSASMTLGSCQRREARSCLAKSLGVRIASASGAQVKVVVAPGLLAKYVGAALSPLSPSGCSSSPSNARSGWRIGGRDDSRE